jgi:erythromycin esterase
MNATSTFALGNARDLDPLLKRLSGNKIVLLGEASHGTHEFYNWRSTISMRLMEEYGFNFVAVEGDWPDCYRVNRFVKGLDQRDASPQEVLKAFKRWPTWMWANWEVAAFVEWLKEFNFEKKGKKSGFYGLDMYSLWESMETLLAYLKNEDPGAAHIAETALDCFSGLHKDEQKYAVKSLSEPCKNEVQKLLKEIRMKAPAYDHDPEAELNTVQNAHVAVEAEKYYRHMMSFDNRTWNIRDRHMMETLERLLEFHGKNAKAIVWEHNTHVGDARYTDMAESGMFNVGQLCREKYPSNTFIVGFGSYEGTVMAGSSWGSPMQEMELPKAAKGSVEEIFHNESTGNRYTMFGKDTAEDHLIRVKPHRAVGVVYNPIAEKHNYVPTLLSKRYDAFIYLDVTKALHPLHVRNELSKVPETYPFTV